jgi:formimidoylglutamate deiminase
MSENTKLTAWLPDLLYRDGRWHRDTALFCTPDGLVAPSSPAGVPTGTVKRLPGRALLPGMINAHSHAFQRVIRGRTEHRSSKETDSFWTWREMMYSAATRLSPDDVYEASRMAFLEMALSGITTVGEFHYLHRDPAGRPYGDVNLLAKQVVRAANEVGIRIALLRVAYFRSGFNVAPNPLQARFIEHNVETYLLNTGKLRAELTASGDGRAWLGLAPHSVRAVQLDQLRKIGEYASRLQAPVHMHIAEQPAELKACVKEYGKTPIELLSVNGLLNARFTGVHAIHISADEIAQLARSGASVCACPTTERNLGDGIIPADKLLAAGVPISLGSDSHAQIDLLEDARELEYHLRLRDLQRNVLAPEDPRPDALAARLFLSATVSGARSLGFGGGTLKPGTPADFFTVDLNDPSIAGADEDSLLAAIMFTAGRAAIRDVCVGGQMIVADGIHQAHSDIIAKFKALQERLWS